VWILHETTSEQAEINSIWNWALSVLLGLTVSFRHKAFECLEIDLNSFTRLHCLFLINHRVWNVPYICVWMRRSSAQFIAPRKARVIFHRLTCVTEKLPNFTAVSLLGYISHSRCCNYSVACFAGFFRTPLGQRRTDGMQSGLVFWVQCTLN